VSARVQNTQTMRCIDRNVVQLSSVLFTARSSGTIVGTTVKEGQQILGSVIEATRDVSLLLTGVVPGVADLTNVAAIDVRES